MRKRLLFLKIFVLAFALQVQGQAFTENFDNIGALAGNGWVQTNASVPTGILGWFQGTNVGAGGPFDAFNGAANAYIGVNYNSTSGAGIISNWLLTPNRTFKNGDTFSFYTRKPAPDTYPDRLEVRLSSNGASTSVGTGIGVGDYTKVLLSVNPTLTTGVYPTAWTQYTITISGLTAPTSGRIGMRYFVTSGGPSGNNSDYIGIDNAIYTPYVCPTLTITPAAGALTAANGGMAYSNTLTQTGALGAPSYAITSGSLPTGLTLSAAGVISGTATVTGSFGFTVTVSDASGCSGSQAYTLEVNSCDVNLTGSLTDVTAECAVSLADLTAPSVLDSCGNTIVATTNSSLFPINTLGTTVITWTYTDLLGTTQTQTQDIIIYDFTDPTPDSAVLTDITSECALAEADVTAPTATDNCSGTVTVTNNGVFPITALGTTQITWTYTDGAGNTTTQVQDVIIYDSTDPTPDAALLTDITSECALAEADVIAPTATDNCSAVTVTNDAVFPITALGTTQITWTYTDAAGNTTTQVQDVIIYDFTDPTPDAAVLTDITSECALAAADVIAPTATDNCSAVTVTNDAVFPITALGTTQITWTYTDAAGNTTTQVQDVIIYDFTDPTPDAAVLTDITSECALTAADVIAPTATDNCSAVTVTNDAVFPITALGTTQITWTYTDAAGNTTTQVQDVIIYDFTDPIADTPVLADIIAACSVEQTDVTAPTATDNCSAVTVTNDAVFPITTQGTTVITWTYTDAAGNTTTQTQDVVIEDTIAPTPAALTLSDITADCSVAQADVTAPTATDNCTGSVTVTNDATFPITTEGTTVITWTYTDASGNTATQTQNVIIEDTIAPTPAALTLSDITADCSVAQADVTAPAATDNCTGSVTVTNDAVFPITVEGTTVITWTYTDASGNTATQTQNVIIEDTIDPTFTVTDINVSVDVLGNATITADQLLNGTAADNCAVATISVTPDAFNCEALGPQTVTVTVTDIHGNAATANATVTVSDPNNFCEALAVVKNQKASFAIYPNPTTNVVFIQPAGNEGIRTIALYTLSGQLIMQKAFNASSETRSISLDRFATGTYLLKLETAAGTFTKRVVKQ